MLVVARSMALLVLGLLTIAFFVLGLVSSARQGEGGKADEDRREARSGAVLAVRTAVEGSP